MSQSQRSPFDRRRDRAARIALYGSALLLVGVGVGLTRLVPRSADLGESVSWAETDFAALPEVQLLQRYIQIDTSLAGDEVAGARFLERELAAAGIPSTVEVLGRSANLWAVLEGKDPNALVLHHHIDVEPVPDPRLWTKPPFSGEIEPPWIHGRGAFDMKSVAIAQLLAFIDLKQSGRPLERSVIFLATGGEERGSDLGMRWILRQHPELVGRFWGVLTEGGAVEGRDIDDVKYWGTEVVQKRFVDLTVCSGERAPLAALQRELTRRGHTTADLRLIPEVERFLASYAGTRDHDDLRLAMGNPRAVLADREGFEKLPGYVQSMFRDEIVPFAIREAPGGGYEMPLKLHLLPGSDVAAARARLLPGWMTFGLQVVVRDEQGAGHGSPLDHPLFEATQRVLQRRYPGVETGPLFLPWTATDARFLRAAGIPAYGFSPFLILTPDTMHVDGVNERIALPGYVSGVALYRELVREIAG